MLRLHANMPDTPLSYGTCTCKFGHPWGPWNQTPADAHCKHFLNDFYRGHAGGGGGGNTVKKRPTWTTKTNSLTKEYLIIKKETGILNPEQHFAPLQLGILASAEKYPAVSLPGIQILTQLSKELCSFPFTHTNNP